MFTRGRFGMLTTGIDKFYWDMELLQDGLYPDEPLDNITNFSAHHLRFVDWIEDEGVLDKIQLDADKKEEIIDLIETLNDKRPEVKPASHVIDHQRLIEEDFWTLTDLRIVLFDETHSSTEPHGNVLSKFKIAALPNLNFCATSFLSIRTIYRH
jgi:hypothetical protein